MPVLHGCSLCPEAIKGSWEFISRSWQHETNWETSHAIWGKSAHLLSNCSWTTFWQIPWKASVVMNNGDLRHFRVQNRPLFLSNCHLSATQRNHCGKKDPNPSKTTEWLKLNGSSGGHLIQIFNPLIKLGRSVALNQNNFSNIKMFLTKLSILPQIFRTLL